MSPKSILKRYFGYDDFRPGQLEIVNSAIRGQDTLALLPTGGGKSICFQVPGILLGGTTIVISPLIALMKDQVDALGKQGVTATYLASNLGSTEVSHRLKLFSKGKYQFLYLSPERALTPHFIKLCQQINITLIVIDEAHCCSQWGHDFRPEYLQLGKLLESLLPRPVCLALTATATLKTQSEIISTLRMRQAKILTQSFRRTNLCLSTKYCLHPGWQWWHLVRILRDPSRRPALIYAGTQEGTEKLTQYLSLWLPKVAVASYHAGLSATLKNLVQDSYLTNEIDVVCATNAFGMGINKPNIQTVLHVDPSLSLEGYFQEAGRAGRAGQPAQAHLIWSPSSAQAVAEYITNPIARQQFSAVSKYLKEKGCKQAAILRCFGEVSTTPNCGNCDRCTALPRSQQDEELRLNFILAQQTRALLANRMKLPPRFILTDLQLHWLALLRPEAPSDWLKIPGLGRGWWEKFGYQWGTKLN